MSSYKPITKEEPIKPREYARARENNPTKPTNTENDDALANTTMGNDDALASWEPSQETRAFAHGYGVDLVAEAEAFRDHIRTGGRMPSSLDAAFRTWIRRTDTYGKTRAHTPTPTPQPRDHTHRHHLACEHVRNIMSPYESAYNHERDGYGPSDWMKACDQIATMLNTGNTPQQALQQLNPIQIQPTQERIHA